MRRSKWAEASIGILWRSRRCLVAETVAGEEAEDSRENGFRMNQGSFCVNTSFLRVGDYFRELQIFRICSGGNSCHSKRQTLSQKNIVNLSGIVWLPKTNTTSLGSQSPLDVPAHSLQGLRSQWAAPCKDKVLRLPLLPTAAGARCS